MNCVANYTKDDLQLLHDRLQIPAEDGNWHYKATEDGCIYSIRAKDKEKDVKIIVKIKGKVRDPKYVIMKASRLKENKFNDIQLSFVPPSGKIKKEYLFIDTKGEAKVGQSNSNYMPQIPDILYLSIDLLLKLPKPFKRKVTMFGLDESC